MTPREYLETVVEPNIAEQKVARGDLRMAHNAVHAVDALAAHIFDAGKGSLPAKDDRAYRKNLAELHPDFRLVRDVAKAIKHVELTEGKQDPPLVHRASQLTAKSTGWGEGVWGEMVWGGLEQATVTTDAGNVRALATVLDNALEVLKGEMAKLGL